MGDEVAIVSFMACGSANSTLHAGGYKLWYGGMPSYG
jgi:hypothetical protein